MYNYSSLKIYKSSIKTRHTMMSPFKKAKH